MELNFAVSPGTILKEYMDARGLTQKKLAEITESSERHISNLINGKIRLTEDFALKLEKVFSDVKAEYWMNLETAYKLYLLRNEETEIKGLKTIAEEFNFKYVFKGMKLSLKEQAVRMLELLQLKSFDEVDNKLSQLEYSFMEDSGNKKAIYLWLKLCEEELEIQNDLDLINLFEINKLIHELGNFKKLMYTQDYTLACKNLRRFSNYLGIALVILDAIPNSKIRGATKYISEMPVIFLSTRYKRLDTFYFAFMHEIAHIIQGKTIRNEYSISLEKDEELSANSFARQYFIDPVLYNKFVKEHPTQDTLCENDIISFSKSQKVIPDILLGYLEYDKIVTNQAKYYYLKGKY